MSYAATGLTVSAQGSDYSLLSLAEDIPSMEIPVKGMVWMVVRHGRTPVNVIGDCPTKGATQKVTPKGDVRITCVCSQREVVCSGD